MNIIPKINMIIIEIIIIMKMTQMKIISKVNQEKEQSEVSK